MDLVGAEVPKGVVLLADITPSLAIKLIAPYFIHRVPYAARVVFCASLSFSAVVVSLVRYKQTGSELTPIVIGHNSRLIPKTS